MSVTCIRKTGSVGSHLPRNGRLTISVPIKIKRRKLGRPINSMIALDGGLSGSPWHIDHAHNGNQTMQHKLIIIALVGVGVTALTGCATYKTTLTDAQGRTVTCEASGKSGIVTGYYLRRGFEDCLASAKAQGFKKRAEETER